MPQQLFIKELYVENFKALKQLNATNFGQINLITGKNNSGKTALLEALFLNLGPTNPLLWLNINGRRGLEKVSPKQSTVPYLFYQMDVSRPILFEVKMLNYHDSELRIIYKERPSYEVSRAPRELDELFNSQVSIAEAEEEAVAVELTFTPEDSAPIVTKLVILPGRIQREGDTKPVYPICVYLSTGGRLDPREDANRYDQLNKTGLLDQFENLLRVIEPNLRRTSLGIENDIPMIYADVGYGLVPLTMLGSGSRRLTTILLALAYSRNGVVLIDEVENGFHHHALPNIWSAIAELAEGGQQVFATTHSDECIQAALDIFKKKKHLDFRVHRLDRKPERTDLFTFTKEQLEAALETGWDVR